MAFWTVFWDKGDNFIMWMIKVTIKANQIDMDVMVFLKSRWHTKTMFIPKVWRFPLLYWSAGILPSRTTMVPKIYRELSALAELQPNASSNMHLSLLSLVG